MKRFISLILVLISITTLLVACKNAPQDSNSDAVNLSALKTHDDVQSLIITGDLDVAILPEPKATVAINTAKQEGINYNIALNLSDEWSKVSQFALTMGCLAVNNNSASQKAGAINTFLDLYKASIEYINSAENHESAASMIVDAGILPKLPIAKSALNNLYGSIVYQDGAEMKTSLSAFYTAINIDQPNDAFYYNADKSASNNGEKLVVGVMNGPTGMGMAKLINDFKGNDCYEFRMYTSPETAIVDLKTGELDLACLPTNAVANAANKGMPISVTAINTLGSLYVVVKEGVTVNSINDLVGKTVYYGVPTSTTAPIFTFILTQNGIEVNIIDE